MSINEYLENGGAPEDLPKTNGTPFTDEDWQGWYNHKSSSEVWEEEQEREAERAELEESKNLDTMYSNNYER